jgi:hypothetical protein
MGLIRNEHGVWIVRRSEIPSRLREVVVRILDMGKDRRTFLRKSLGTMDRKEATRLAPGGSGQLCGPPAKLAGDGSQKNRHFLSLERTPTRQIIARRLETFGMDTPTDSTDSLDVMSFNDMASNTTLLFSAGEVRRRCRGRWL